MSFLATANDWVEHANLAVTSEAAFIQHVEGEDNRIMLQDLGMGVVYEVACGPYSLPGSNPQHCANVNYSH